MLTSPRRKLWKPFITALWQSTWLWRVPIEISTWGGVRGENWVWIMFYFNACNEQSSGGQWTNLKSSKCIIQKLEITSLPSSVIPKNRKFKLGMDECKWDVKRSQFISVILSNNRMRFLFFFSPLPMAGQASRQRNWNKNSSLWTKKSVSFKWLVFLSFSINNNNNNEIQTGTQVGFVKWTSEYPPPSPPWTLLWYGVNF